MTDLAAVSLEKSKWRADFPLLSHKVRGKNLVYLDSAATSLKPWPVIERVGHFLTYQTANVHRGAHFLSNQATQAFEESRQAVADFIAASSSDEIIFTRGTTESMNLVAQSWGARNLKAGDEILLTEMEHHSGIVPWQMIAERMGAKVRAIPVNAAGEVMMESLAELVTAKTKVISVVHCSNTLGTINPVKELGQWARKVGALFVIDGAQMVCNSKVDVRDLGADFYAFSGHKMFGPYGIGVLYGRREILETLPPYQGGGSMISEVRFEKTTYQDIPHRFEAGTPNIEGVLGLKAAIDYLKALDRARVEEFEAGLRRTFESRLLEIGGYRLIGEARHKGPISSFVFETGHASDVGQILDQENVAVRAGHHCTQPLMKRLGVDATVRASFSIYNQMSDIDALIHGLIKAKELLS